MIDALPLLLGPEGYQISRSVRLRSSASAYFGRTPATTTNRTTWTWSGWVKRGSLGSNATIFSAGTGSAIDTNWLAFLAGDFLAYSINDGTYFLQTTQVFRDPSAWYHIVLATDTTQATASNRTKLYVNGIQITAFSTANYPAQNHPQLINTPNLTVIGAKYRTAVQDYFDGYITEVNFIDGQQLTPASFGETNLVTGVWQPKKYAGTYGTNGFYLNFSDNSAATAAAIGKDSSGNGNNWTPNNISVTAGATYDSMLDVPTQWADGGNGRGNYATLNPLSFYAGGGSGTVSDGNLKVALTNQRAHHGTMALLSSKWYWEAKLTSASVNSTGAGIVTDAQAASNTSPYNGWVFDVQAGRNYYNGSFTTLSGGAFATGDTISIAVDLDSGKIWYAKNGTWLGTSADPAAGTGAAQTNVSGSVLPVFYEMNSGFSATWEANFGQRPFSYTPPTGFKALNTLNLPTPTILKGNQFFDATLWTGNGTTQNITNSGGMQPDFLWVKTRSGTTVNWLVNAVTGASNGLISNSTAAEQNLGIVTSFNANGFSVSTIGGTNLTTNGNAATYVGWQWKANGTPAVTNTAGSITSQVSVGGTQGFSIVTYTGTGANATVGHGLGVAPKMIINKDRINGSVGWDVYHASMNASPATGRLQLNTTAAFTTDSTIWNNTAPTSSVFSIGTGSSANINGNSHVVYCFSEVAGFSKFGSYTGNGSADGPFVFCGFRPRWVMIKETGNIQDWVIYDTARAAFNADDLRLLANSSGAELNTGFPIDELSNGFKVRNSGNGTNRSGGTYIFAAFAEHPFKNALAR
jgi:hypothetical protein